MKTKAIVSISILLIIAVCGGLGFAADKVVVIPLNSTKVAGSNGQLLYNNNGTVAGSQLYYDAGKGNLGVGVASPDPNAKLDVNGAGWFNLSTGRILLTTPGGWPGIIAQTSTKRMDISFRDGYINLASSYNLNAPPTNFGLTIKDNGRVGVNTTTPVSALNVQGEIRATDSNGANRLWGKGRPGATVVTDNGLTACTGNGLKYSVSTMMVSWGEAEQACPAGTWVCTASERGTSPCTPTGVSIDLLACDGSIEDAQDNDNLHSYYFIPAWVADADPAMSSARAKTVRLNGDGDLSAVVCNTRPVWCCQYLVHIL